MKIFLKKIVIFSMSIILILLFPILILYGSKESFNNIDNEISNFNKNKYLIGYAYNGQNYKYLKYKTILTQPNKYIWALGSSRVLQFRKEMFDLSFYNAGYTISSLTDFKQFMKSIPVDKYPKILIVGLDQWMFNENWDSLNKEIVKDFYINITIDYNKQFNILDKVYYDYFINKKIRINSLIETNRNFIPIGLNAFMNSTGFRNDGSFYYGSQISKLLKNDNTAEDFLYEDTFKRIERGDRWFKYASNVNPKSLVILDSFLDFCEKNNIEVIAFTPPFADAVYKKMKESDNYKYLIYLNSKIKPIFNKYKFEFYQFNNMNSCNSNDSETIDGVHGSERTYLKLLLEILSKQSILNMSCNSSRLKEDLNNGIDRYLIYSY